MNELNVVSPLFSSRNLANSCCPPPRLLGGFLMSLFQRPVFLLHFFSSNMFYLAHSLYISAYIHVHVCMASLMAPVTVEGGKVWFRQPSPVLSSDTGWQRSGERVFAEQKGEKLAGSQIW